MDNLGESPTDKGGDPGESEETRATPGAPVAADTEGIPEETDRDGDADLKEAAAEEGEVGRSLWIRLREYRGCASDLLSSKTGRTRIHQDSL